MFSRLFIHHNHQSCCQRIGLSRTFLSAQIYDWCGTLELLISLYFCYFLFCNNEFCYTGKYYLQILYQFSFKAKTVKYKRFTSNIAIRTSTYTTAVSCVSDLVKRLWLLLQTDHYLVKAIYCFESVLRKSVVAVIISLPVILMVSILASLQCIHICDSFKTTSRRKVTFPSIHVCSLCKRQTSLLFNWQTPEQKKYLVHLEFPLMGQFAAYAGEILARYAEVKILYHVGWSKK